MVTGGKKHVVPSVTTVLSSLAKPALIPWAVNQTVAYIRDAIAPSTEHAESFLETIYQNAKREATSIKRAAADIGTQAHLLLSGVSDTCKPDLGSIESTPVRNCVSAGLEWLAAHEVTWVCQERPIYSRRYKYSGRLDGIARVDGILSLIDWKSSKGIYPEYRLQCASYNHGYEEEFPDEHIEQRILIRLGKEDGVFEPHVYPRNTLRQDFAAFLGCLSLHKRLKQIEREEKLSQKSKKGGQIE